MKKGIYLLCLLISFDALAYVDLNLSYTYSLRRVKGIETSTNPDPGEALSTTSGYTINWAWYIWEYTALEFNFGETTQRLKDDREIATDDDTLTILELDSTLVTQVQGVGIRQAFASRKASIIPSISIGYAQYTTSGKTKYSLDRNGTDDTLTVEKDKETFNSYYAGVGLKFRFTQLLGLTLAAKTVLQDLDTSEAGDNVTYSAGLSWVF